MSSYIYDIIIIGGGISGLNCAYQLSTTNKKILLIDERKYFGGRILTYYDKNYHYELGAGRFNNSHTNLLKLIKKFKLNKVEIDTNSTYVDKKKFEKNNYKLFIMLLKKIINKFKNINSEILKNYTFKELCYKYYNKKYINLLIKYFGYKAEFEILNSYDAIKTFKLNFINNKKFYILQEGLSELCKRMVYACNNAKENSSSFVNFKLNTKVTNIVLTDNLYTIISTDNYYKCKNIILAVKKNDLLKFEILHSIKNILNSVMAAPLLRIYAYYPCINNKFWFDDLDKMVTNTKLKFIIPVNKKYGIIMISYTDYNDTKPFIKNNKIKKDSDIINIINTELKKIFDFDIPNPIKINSYYWINGCHYWKKKYDSANLSKYLINPIKNIYICGESYSLNQAWIEGALQTSNKVVKKIKKNILTK
jgi:protoporphyrinogen oxidase